MRNTTGPLARLISTALFGLMASPVMAQDADPFDPAASNAGDSGGLVTESPFVPGVGPAVGVYTSLAEETVVVNYADGHTEPFVSQVVGTTLHGGYVLGRVRIDAMLPIYPWVDAPVSGFNGPAIGDMRLQSTIPLVGATRAFSLAIVPKLAIASGNVRAYTRRGTHLGGTLALGGETPVGLDWTVNAGFLGSQSSAIREVGISSSLDLSGALVMRLDDSFRIGAEADYSYGFAWSTFQSNPRATGNLFVRSVSEEGIGLTVGLGSALNDGVGAPEHRLFAALSYAFANRGPRDTDKDGIPNDIDMCETDPEDFDDYEDTDGCPELDNDGDGLLDSEDKCPLSPEDPDDFQDEDGCPEPDNDSDLVLDPNDACPMEFGLPENNGCPDGDKDSDGILDSVDACPEEAGPEATQGCPDRDGDRVPDSRDKCPDEPIPPDADPEQSDGCPKRVYITEAKIVITEKVYFETGRAVIKPESFGLLGDVAKIINEAPRIKVLEVQGHTDSEGGDASNQRLSEDRAKAVRTWLIEDGKVDAARLTAKGYGESQPIDTNRTESGRSKNRRVEFSILEQTVITREVPAPAPSSEDEAPEPDEKPEAENTPWGSP